MANKSNPTPASLQTEKVLLAHTDGRPVHVHDAEGDRFLLPMPNAILGCQFADQLLSHFRSISEKQPRFLQTVTEWATQHEAVERVIHGLKSPTEGSVLLVMTSGSHHQPQIEDSVTELDLALHREFSEFRIEIATVPALGVSDISMFMDPANSREIYVRPPSA